MRGDQISEPPKKEEKVNIFIKNQLSSLTDVQSHEIQQLQPSFFYRSLKLLPEKNMTGWFHKDLISIFNFKSYVI